MTVGMVKSLYPRRPKNDIPSLACASFPRKLIGMGSSSMFFSDLCIYRGIISPGSSQRSGALALSETNWLNSTQAHTSFSRNQSAAELIVVMSVVVVFCCMPNSASALLRTTDRYFATVQGLSVMGSTAKRIDPFN